MLTIDTTTLNEQVQAILRMRPFEQEHQDAEVAIRAVFHPAFDAECGVTLLMRDGKPALSVQCAKHSIWQYLNAKAGVPGYAQVDRWVEPAIANERLEPSVREGSGLIDRLQGLANGVPSEKGLHLDGIAGASGAGRHDERAPYLRPVVPSRCHEPARETGSGAVRSRPGQLSVGADQDQLQRTAKVHLQIALNATTTATHRLHRPQGVGGTTTPASGACWSRSARIDPALTRMKGAASGSSPSVSKVTENSSAVF